MNLDDDIRPDPDQLLSLVKADEKKRDKGKLKIFLGMAAGVGKTFTMLKAAKEAKAAGIDVVIGIVETHGRKDTIEQMQGLEILPRRKMPHKGVALEELDLDAVIKRKPQLVLVDELAHTNAPGSRHTKRYLDILELINAGIDVFTTINIQHLDSRVDTVRQITGVTVHESVPDSFFDHADEVVLIDLSPDELLKRLKEGRIYPTERINTAEQNFFQKGNLTALREMALRLAAERVDRELRDFKQLHGIEEAWKSSNRLMVAIFASPYSETLIRWTRRLSDLMDATWVGVYVDNNEPLSDEEKGLLAKNISLAHQLGGEVVSTKDSDVVSALLRVARKQNVTQIILGKSRRGILGNLLRGGSVVSRLLRMSGDIDIYSVSPEIADRPAAIKLKKVGRYIFPWDEMGWLFAAAFASWGVAGFLQPFIGYIAVGCVFLFSVCLSGLFFSRTSVLLLALALSGIHNFFFIPPLHSFAVSRPEDIMMLLMFFVTAATVGHLTSRLKGKERVLRTREDGAIALYELTKQLAKAQSVDDVARVGISQIAKIANLDVSLYLVGRSEASNRLNIHVASTFVEGEKEKAVAEWVFQNSKPAGRFTDTLQASQGFYLPLLGKSGPLGVVGINVKKQGEIDTEHLLLIKTCIQQIASALERETFHQQAKDIYVLEETQKLYKTLLDSVSHELKTPLAAIKGSASALLDPKIKSSPDASDNLATEILLGSSRLQRLVENLLDMTRLESGMLKSKAMSCGIEDLLGSVLRKMAVEVPGRKIDVSIAKNVTDVTCDPVLVEQALANILHNALVYSPESTAVEIIVDKDGEYLRIDIKDHGHGLPKDNPDQIFEKFYRAHPEKTGGIGLGLSIARRLIELQKGKLTAKNHEGGGALFSVYLPLEVIR